MPTILRAARLPDQIRNELDQRLRAAAYGEIRAISDWLKERGIEISKSGLSRYAVRLRAADASRSIGVAATLEAKPRTRPSVGEPTDCIGQILFHAERLTEAARRLQASTTDERVPGRDETDSAA